jgi:antitoxin ParD1/3/4
VNIEVTFMTISLRPELAKFIDEQVKTGRFNSADDAVNAAVEQFRQEEELLAEDPDDSDVEAIEEGLAQLNRGEGRPWSQVRADLAERLLKQ